MKPKTIEVVKYEAKDSSLHDTPKECLKHELRELFAENGVCSGGEWSADMIVEFLIEERDELKKLFTSI
jgi:hypothetical protein